MWPQLGLVKTYLPVYLASILAHFAVALLIARRLRLRWPIPLAVSTSYLLGMTAGAKALFDIQHGLFTFRSLLTAGHYLQGGMWGGPLAHLGMAIALAILLTRNRLAALDLIALSLPVPLAIAKVACLCNGCCHGKPTGLPWAVTFPPGQGPAPGGVPVHPTQVYEMLVLALAGVTLYRVNQPRWRGTLLLWFLAVYGIGRPLTELFRGDLARQLLWGPFTQSQWLCAVAGGISVCILLVCRRRSGPKQIPLPPAPQRPDSAEAPLRS